MILCPLFLQNIWEREVSSEVTSVVMFWVHVLHSGTNVDPLDLGQKCI
jgi:ribulose 1,5-bisphosphate synthetase/thiazole synthase